VEFLEWVSHLQAAYFEEKSLLNWTLDPGEGEPPQYPNVYRNPLAQITMKVPTAPVNDPQRGPASPRHKAWSADGNGSVTFEWVSLESSLQWGAFRRLVQLLRERGDDVLVVLGPFNEHMIAEQSQPAYRKICDGIAAWLAKEQINYLRPEVLPSSLYADASHPLTDGYALLAHQIYADRRFQDWLNKP
jgi:hypothetical protein